MSSKARKEISREVKDGKEIVVSEYKEFDFDKDLLWEIESRYDDWDVAQCAGIYYAEEELQIIDVDKLIDYLDDQLKEKEESSDDEQEDCEFEKKLIEYLKPYEGFTIWV